MTLELPRTPVKADLPLLTFALGDQDYALPIGDVVEVAVMVALTRLADVPAAVLGMANRQGQVLPMLDLAQIMGHDPVMIDDTTLFIVAGASRLAGLVVDTVRQVEYVSRNKLDKSAAGKYIRGIISYEQRLIQVIELDAVLNAYLSDAWSLESE